MTSTKKTTAKTTTETVELQLPRFGGPDQLVTLAGATVTRHAPVQVSTEDWAATVKRRPEFAGYVDREE